MPGVGRKSAQRIALHLLRGERADALHLAKVLQQAMERIGHCARCRTFSENELCKLCGSSQRDPSQLCVIESPAEVMGIEETGYRGGYFVLLGHLSPLDGIGPEHLGLDLLSRRVREENVREVILATNSTVEGEATAHYIREMLNGTSARVTRIAQGVPVGGELEYLDSHTLARAFDGRREL